MTGPRRLKMSEVGCRVLWRVYGFGTAAEAQHGLEHSAGGSGMTGQPRGYNIRIFLHDGMPDGLRFVEKSNWTGHGIVCPRPRYSTAKALPEFHRTGVYLLVGPTADENLQKAYIGEGDPIRDRLDDHHANKDFWTSVIAFTSKDSNLNKAHVQYLESRLISLAREAKRCTLDNGNTPALPSLSDADTAEVETFLDEMLLIFPLLGVTVFEKPPVPTPQERMLHMKAKGATAKGYEASQGFVVFKGSTAVRETVPSIEKYLVTLRKRLIEQGILEVSGDHYVLTQDYTFDSPSMAAGVMAGRTANGRDEWKDESGRSLKDIQSAEG